MLMTHELTFSFQHLQLFEKLGFELKPGGVLHLTGPNGCGKSTLLAILAGLRTQFSGEISFMSEGKKVENHREYMEYLSAETNGLYRQMTARQNLEFWSHLGGKKTSSESLSQCLKRWGLSSPLLQSFPVCRFSTGMKRRLALARVELSGRPCLLLDEPLNGLDRAGIEVFKGFIKERQEKSGMAIIVSHDRQSLNGLITKELSL